MRSKRAYNNYRRTNMGNRAVIQMQGQDVGLYLHWNGGLDTVQPLLDVAKEYGLRGDNYGIARLAQIAGNYLGGTLGIGVSTIDRIHRDNFDNGTYVIDSQFNIVERLFTRGPEQQNHDYDEMKQDIKNANDKFFKER
jgi:hypothetical protein